MKFKLKYYIYGAIALLFLILFLIYRSSLLDYYLTKFRLKQKQEKVKELDVKIKKLEDELKKVEQDSGKYKKKADKLKKKYEEAKKAKKLYEDELMDLAAKLGY